MHKTTHYSLIGCFVSVQLAPFCSTAIPFMVGDHNVANPVFHGGEHAMSWLRDIVRQTFSGLNARHKHSDHHRAAQTHRQPQRVVQWLRFAPGPWKSVFSLLMSRQCLFSIFPPLPSGTPRLACSSSLRSAALSDKTAQMLCPPLRAAGGTSSNPFLSAVASPSLHHRN